MTECSTDWQDQKKDGDDNVGPVTAARRNQNLATIRNQPGWDKFPDCLPLSLRTTKGGKLTDFGNTKLRILERIASNADFSTALAYFMKRTQRGSRILRLKDLEMAADHFDASSKGPSRADPRHGSEAISIGESEEALQTLDHQSRGGSVEMVAAKTQRQRDMRATPARAATRTSRQIRYRDESTGRSGESSEPPTKRPNVGNVSEPTIEHVDADEDSLGAQTLVSIKATSFQSNRSLQSSLSTARELQQDYWKHSKATERLITSLRSQIVSQVDLISRMMLHEKELETQLANPIGFLEDLGESDRAAKEGEARTRLDLEQAKTARDALNAQYGNSDSSLSRAILATVENEFAKAQIAFNSARAYASATQVDLNRAIARLESIPLEKTTVDETLTDVLQHYPKWLDRLGEIQGSIVNQMRKIGND